MLQELGFPNLFVKWVMQCLGTVSYSILVNGFPTPPIPAQKGLRQGDPMSPYLFTYIFQDALPLLLLMGVLAIIQGARNWRDHPYDVS